MTAEVISAYSVPFISICLIPYASLIALKRKTLGLASLWLIFATLASIWGYTSAMGSEGPIISLPYVSMVLTGSLWVCLCCATACSDPTLRFTSTGRLLAILAWTSLVSSALFAALTGLLHAHMNPSLSAPIIGIILSLTALGINLKCRNPITAYICSITLLSSMLVQYLMGNLPFLPNPTGIGICVSVIAGAIWVSQASTNVEPLKDTRVIRDLVEPTILLNRDQIIVKVNDAAKTLFWGDKGVRLVGRNLSEILPLNVDNVRLETPLGRRSFDVRVSTLRDRGGDSVSGYLVVLSPVHVGSMVAVPDGEKVNSSCELALEAVRDSIWEWNVKDSVLNLSPHLYNAFGYSREEVPASLSEWRNLIHHDDLPDIDILLNNLRNGLTEDIQQDLRIKGRKGGWHWIHFRGKIVERASDGEVVKVVGVQSDSSVRRAKEALLSYRALYDELTDLPNRFLLLDRLQQEISRASRLHAGFALVFCDVNDFKSINDTYGHGGGDGLLRQIAQRLSSCIRETDTVGRLGGDEFVMILPGQMGSTTEAKIVLDRIIRAMKEPFIIDGNTVTSSMSMGIALAPEHGRDTEQLMKAADIAMYTAKSRGGNRYIFYSPALLGKGVQIAGKARSQYASQLIRRGDAARPKHPETTLIKVRLPEEQQSQGVPGNPVDKDKDKVLVN